MSADLFTVALEEHFAIPAILDRTAHVVGPMSEEHARMQVPLLLDLDDARLEAMDAAGVDVQVISHTAPGMEWVAAREARAIAVEANDVLADAVGRHPDRYAGLAALPVTDPGAAADELRRAVGLGLKGALVNGIADGRFLDDPVYADVLATAEELGVPIYVHPGVPPAAVREAYYSGIEPRIDAILATAAWGWHAETAVHVLRLIASGVFDRHPGLDIVIGHMGEMLPPMAGRVEMLLGAVADLERPIREYFSSNVYITIAGVFDPIAFRGAASLVGIDRMMFSIDYPYVPAAPATAFLHNVELDPDDRRKFAGGNASRLLQLRP